MMRILLLSTLIIAIGMAFFLIKVLSSKNGTFSSQHIHDSEAMRERGIHCVMDQDREMRRKSRFAVDESTSRYLESRISESRKLENNEITKQ
jgi:predicted adenine nucleotide alpha hydrolase (AANH) superfamily ATPase